MISTQSKIIIKIMEIEACRIKLQVLLIALELGQQAQKIN